MGEIIKEIAEEINSVNTYRVLTIVIFIFCLLLFLISLYKFTNSNSRGKNEKIEIKKLHREGTLTKAKH
jgi:hypothetical protein